VKRVLQQIAGKPVSPVCTIRCECDSSRGDPKHIIQHMVLVEAINRRVATGCTPDISFGTRIGAGQAAEDQRGKIPAVRAAVGRTGAGAGQKPALRAH
jgi:hypothetical protein